MLTDGGSTSPLIMHAGDTVTIHAYTTAARDGFHLTVTDRTTGHAGTRLPGHGQRLRQS